MKKMDLVWRQNLYVTFRVIIGLLFFMHGGQKLFGWFSPSSSGVQLNSLFGVAGVIEFSAGILLVLGMFTSFVALVSAVEMIFAYSIGHLSRGILPLSNGGEPAVLFFASFLVLIAYGSGPLSLERLILKREVFHKRR